MADQPSHKPDDGAPDIPSGAQNAPDLTPDEKHEVEELKQLRVPVVYEIIRKEGIEELKRPVLSLWWSGLTAGIAISVSVLAEGMLHHYLPDTPWRPLVENFGYCVGFLIVILGRLQLFTENTITVIIPLLSDFSGSHLYYTMRLWGVVLFANLCGTFVMALLMLYGGLFQPDHVTAMLKISHHLTEYSAMQALLYGIPAGFLIAAIVWMMPNAEHAAFWVIIMMTYVIALGGFTHVVAGSNEVFLLILNGDIDVQTGVFGLLLPTLIGNIIGGTGLFAMLAHRQVREEI